MVFRCISISVDVNRCVWCFWYVSHTRSIVSLIKQHRLSRRGWYEEAEEERLSMIFALPVGITLLTAVVMMLFWPTEFPTIINH